MRDGRGWLGRWRANAVCAALALPLASCGGVLDPAGPVGAGDAEVLRDATVIMLFIVVPTLVLAFWMAWRYRATRRNAKYLPDWSYSGRIEALVWSIPTLTIMFLGGLIWIGSHRLDPFQPLDSKASPIEVQVVAMDWKWLFIYPKEGVASLNELIVPVGRPVHFSITSASVFNVFFIPRLGSMIYAMPGMVSQLYLQADQLGSFWGTSAQFSGDGFSDMRFQTRSIDADAFREWTTKARGSNLTLDRQSYAKLLQQSANDTPKVYKATDTNLFTDIATQKLPAGQGPEPGTAEQTGREQTTLRAK